MYRLNLTTGLINGVGIAVFLNTLVSMAALGATLTAGDSINFDVVVRNEKIGYVKITVGEILPGNSQAGRQALKDGFSPTMRPTLGGLADYLNQKLDRKIDHFNWFQIVEINPTLVGISGTFVDPPKGGIGLSNQWADYRPWFWDEDQPVIPPGPGFVVNPGNQLSVKGPNTSSQLEFFDSPFSTVKGTTFKFNTFLIADFGDKNDNTYDVLGGFSWSALIDPNDGLTKITSLTEGATFTQDYANRIRAEFPIQYTKLLKLPTYEFNGSLSPGQVDEFTQSGLTSGTGFLAWTDNLPGINPVRKPDTVLGVFDPMSKQRIAFNDDGGPFGSNDASGLRNSVRPDGTSGTINLKVTGNPDSDFDGKSRTCQPHPQTGDYKLFVKLYDTTSFPAGSFSAPPTDGSSSSCNPPISLPCLGGSGGSGCPIPIVSQPISTVSEIVKGLPLFGSRNLILSSTSSADSISSRQRVAAFSAATQSPQSVPEPVSGLGLLALGTWGAVQGLKIRKNK